MTVDELQVLITANTNELRKEINNANKTISGLKKSTDKSTSGAMALFSKFKAGIIALGIGQAIKSSIQSGINAIESDSMFDTVLGKNADAIRSWSDEVSNALGLNAYAIRNNAGVIYNMTSSMGVAEDSALKMSKGISLLSEDMASFYNLDSTEAFNKLRAGITGETEPLKALGILVDENTVKQVAYSEGIAENGAELTQQQKVLARYVAILKQTGNAQGDLARTLNSPANQLRQLKQQVTNSGIAFSNLLMPVLKAVLPYITAFTKAITQALTSLSKFLGLGSKDKGTSTETEKISSNVGGIGTNMDKANKKAKQLKNTLAGFDEMNVLQDNSSDSAGASGGGIDSIPLDFDLDEYDAHLDWILESTDNKFKEFFKDFKLPKLDFSESSKGLKKFWGVFKPILDTLKRLLLFIWNDVVVPLIEYVVNSALPVFVEHLVTSTDTISTILEGIEKILESIITKFVKPIAEFINTRIVAFTENLTEKWRDLKTTLEESEIFKEIKALLDEILPILQAIVTAILGVITFVAEFKMNDEWVDFKWIIYDIADVIGLVVDLLKFDFADAYEHARDLLVDNRIDYAKDKVEAFKKSWEDLKQTISDWASTSGKVVSEWAEQKSKDLEDAYNKHIAPLFSEETWDNLFYNVGKALGNAWVNICNWWKTNVAPWFTKEKWNELFSVISKGLQEAWNKVVSFFTTSLPNWWNTKITPWFTKEKWQELGEKMKDGITNGFKGVVNKIADLLNGIISRFENTINWIIRKVNSLTSGINSALPSNMQIKTIKEVKLNRVPYLARGGIIDKPTVAMVGEAGKEAVIPLERNTGWIDQLADKLGEKIDGLGGNIRLIVKLGEDAIFDKFIEYSKSKSFETNGEVFAV